jgi:phosphate transport system protein
MDARINTMNQSDPLAKSVHEGASPGGAHPHYLDEVEALNQRLIHMADLAREHLRLTMHGLVEADAELLTAMVGSDEEVNACQLDVDSRALRLLVRYQPVATELRRVVAALRISIDLERVGDLAVNIAEAAQSYITHPPGKEFIDIPRMADISQEMLSDAIKAFVSGDMALARDVLERDDAVNDLRTAVFTELLDDMMNDKKTVKPALDLLHISRQLERVGDHATNIAESVIFIWSAEDVRHHMPARG